MLDDIIRNYKWNYWSREHNDDQHEDGFQSEWLEAIQVIMIQTKLEYTIAVVFSIFENHISKWKMWINSFPSIHKHWYLWKQKEKYTIQKVSIDWIRIVNSNKSRDRDKI